jgi:hypothetical protein
MGRTLQWDFSKLDCIDIAGDIMCISKPKPFSTKQNNELMDSYSQMDRKQQLMKDNAEIKNENLASKIAMVPKIVSNQTSGEKVLAALGG